MSQMKREPGGEIGPSFLTARAAPRAESSNHAPGSRAALSPANDGPSSGPYRRGLWAVGVSSELAALFCQESVL
jgi:hypothetical protein